MQVVCRGLRAEHASPYKSRSRRRRRAVESGLRRSLVAAGLARAALAEDGELSSAEGLRRGLWQGRWTIVEGIDRSVPLPVITRGALHALPLRSGQPVRRTAARRRCAISSAATRSENIVTISSFGGTGGPDASEKLLPALYKFSIFDGLLPAGVASSASPQGNGRCGLSRVRERRHRAVFAAFRSRGSVAHLRRDDFLVTCRSTTAWRRSARDSTSSSTKRPRSNERIITWPCRRRSSADGAGRSCRAAVCQQRRRLVRASSWKRPIGRDLEERAADQRRHRTVFAKSRSIGSIHYLGKRPSRTSS